MDNAGGSQTLKPIVDKISEYLLESDVQHGASYQISQDATNKVDYATEELKTLINARDPKEVVFGPSSTMMFRILSLTLSQLWEPGDEVITTNSEHEANCSPWMDLQDKGIVVKIWEVNSDTQEFELEDLKALINDRTRLVTMVHASNILGTINPIKEAAKIAHDNDALFAVDGVAYAPHRSLDMQDWDVDFYIFSTYKVYGPHSAVMYGKLELLEKIPSINHYFINKSPYKFQPGNKNFELMYSMSGLTDYLRELHDHHFPDGTSVSDQDKYDKVFDLIADHEERLSNRFIDYLKTRSDITIIGESSGDQSKRVPTISFYHESRKSSEIVEKIDPYGIGIRFGDFYAKKIINALGIEEKDGPIRVSLVHYNTLEEVDQLIQAFEEIL